MARAYERDLELENLNAGPPPEVWETCPDCCGEGYIDKEVRGHIDPQPVRCERCSGAGGWIEEAT